MRDANLMAGEVRKREGSLKKSCKIFFPSKLKAQKIMSLTSTSLRQPQTNFGAKFFQSCYPRF